MSEAAKDAKGQQPQQPLQRLRRRAISVACAFIFARSARSPARMAIRVVTWNSSGNYGLRVVEAKVEASGGITPQARASIIHLHKRAKGRDSTKYGTSKISTRNFCVHHSQRISLAATLGDAKAIRKSIRGHKQQMLKGDHATAPHVHDPPYAK